jgi:hypothetical protein
MRMKRSSYSYFAHSHRSNTSYGSQFTLRNTHRSSFGHRHGFLMHGSRIRASVILRKLTSPGQPIPILTQSIGIQVPIAVMGFFNCDADEAGIVKSMRYFRNLIQMLPNPNDHRTEVVPGFNLALGPQTEISRRDRGTSSAGY